MVSTTNLVSYYKLDETSGTIVDAHGSNDGTNNGATYGVAGIVNTALDFDGVNDYVSAGYSLTTTDITINFWLDWDDMGTSNIQFITESATAGYFMIHAGVVTNGLKFTMDGSVSSLQVTSAIATGLNMYTLTYDGTTALMYRNGTQIGSLTATWGSQTLSTLYIGSRGGSSYFLDGTLDEVGIWSRALSSTEISDLWNSGNGLAYPFSSSSGTNMKINVGDAWKDVDSIKINIGDAWKDVDSIKQNIGDTWKTVF